MEDKDIKINIIKSRMECIEKKVCLPTGKQKQINRVNKWIALNEKKTRKRIYIYRQITSGLKFLSKKRNIMSDIIKYLYLLINNEGI